MKTLGMDFRFRQLGCRGAILLMTLMSSCAASSGSSTARCGSDAYPKELERDGIEGDVILRLALDSSGKITDAAVVESTNPGLSQAAIDALLHDPACRFRPAIGLDGRPVPYVIKRYLFRFRVAW